MIVYNVKRRWFSMKNDAEAYRRGEKLLPEATFKLVIESREELADLLNGLCGTEAAPASPPVSPLFTNAVAQEPIREVLTRNVVRDDVPDFVPKFLADEWRKKQEGTYRP